MKELYGPVVSILIRTIRRMVASIEARGNETVKTLVSGGEFSRNSYNKGEIGDLARQVGCQMIFRTDQE